MHASGSGHRHGRPALASFLSFLWPGAGQWYLGRRRAALAFGLPIAAIALLAVAALQLAGGTGLAIRLFQPGVAAAVVGGVVLACLWRLLSMVDAASRSGDPGAFRGRSLGVLLALAVVAVGIHAAVASAAWSFHTAGQRIFIVDPVPTERPSAPPTLAPGATPPPSAPPTAEPSRRINVLLAGIDSGPGRDHALTDTLIVVSLDPDTREVAMVSFPRDIAHFPLSSGTVFTGKINGLHGYAGRHPEEFPDGAAVTVTREVGHLLGIRVDHYAMINLEGFERMIDQVGGVTVVNERAINDPSYGGWRDGRIGFRLPAGEHTLDGPTALAYVRSRMGAGDNDFTRARRQQQLLVALQRKLTDPTMIPRLSGILDAVAGTIQTNYPAGDLGRLLELSQGIDREAIRQVVLGPPYATRPPLNTTGGIYTLRLDLEKVADLSIDLFGDESRYAKAAASG